MGFDERIAQAKIFEAAALTRINAVQGWHAFSYGQGINPDLGNLLKRMDTLMRWLPDIIAVKDGARLPCAIDCKAGRQDTPNYDIEVKALNALANFHAGLEVNGLFLFEDWKVMHVATAMWRYREGKFKGTGSGTRFVIVDKKFARSFDEIFTPTRMH